MSLRDQLLKSGLANKEQAKKAEKEAKKRHHKELQARKDEPDLNLKDQISLEIEDQLRQQRDADRALNKLREAELHRLESIQRAMNIMFSGDLKEYRAELPYYFIYDGIKIGTILVTEAQQTQLAAGNLAVTSFDKDFRFFLLDRDNAEKIRSCDSSLVLCWHLQETETPGLD